MKALLIWIGLVAACASGPPATLDRRVEPLASPAIEEPAFSEADIPETNPRNADDDVYAITPRFVDGSSDEIYIPKDLDESFVELDRMLHSKFIEKLKAGDKEATNQHFGLGLWIRNNWRLWGGSRLSEHFHNIGIFHPDDMSGIILESYVRRLKDQPIELETQVKFYQDYWAKQKP